MDTVGDMCFAQFAKMYQSCSKSRTSDEESGHPDAKREEDANKDAAGYNTGEAEEDQNENKFNYIMTHKTGKKEHYNRGERLPEYIKLSELYPG